MVKSQTWLQMAFITITVVLLDRFSQFLQCFGRNLFLIGPALSRPPWQFHSTKTILFHREAIDSFHQAHSLFFPWEGWNDVAGHAGNPAHIIMKCPLFSYSRLMQTTSTWCWWCVGRCISACASAHSLGSCSGAWLSVWEGWRVGIAKWGPTELSQNLDLAFAPAAVAEGFHVSINCGGNAQS